MDIRHPLAALLGVAGLVVGTVAAMGGPATAAGNELVNTTVFTCVVTPAGSSAYPAYPYDGKITLSAVRPAGSTTVTVSASMSEMSGVAPVSFSNVDFQSELTFDASGTAVSVKGAGKVNLVATGSPPVGQPFAMPALQGTFTSSAATVTVTTTKFEFKMPGFGMSGVCTPTSGAALGALTIVEGTPPTPTPTPTTTTSPTATPTPSGKPTATPTKDGKTKGKAATGSVTFACVLNPLTSKFDYPATISVSGSRDKPGGDVALSAKMSDLPGISPVPVDGQMDVTLDLTVGGKKTTLKSGTHVVAAPKAEVPIPTLTGSVAADGDELAVVVSEFTFNFAALSIDAVCTADAVALSKMTVGSEPVESDDPPSPSGSTTPVAATLPQTGGGDSTPVVALWALALTLLGVAGLLCVPRTRRQH